MGPHRRAHASRPTATPPSRPTRWATCAQDWFFTTDDAVTATPAVVDGTVYVGDWSGRFYAIDLDTGELDWSFTAEPHAKRLRRADRRVGHGRRRAAARRHGVRPERRDALRPAAPTTARCAGSATSAGPRATTTPPRSRARRRWSTASSSSAPTSTTRPTAPPAGRRRPRRRHRRPPVGRPRPRRPPGDGAHRARAAATCGARPPSTSSAGSCSSAPATARPPRAGATHTEALLALDLDTGERVVDLPAPRAEPRRPRLRRRAQPVRRSTAATSSASATRTPSTTWSTARPASRCGSTKVAEPGVPEDGRQLLVRRVHRRRRPTPTGWWSAAPRSAGRRTCTPSTPTRARSRWQQGEAGPTFAAALEVERRRVPRRHRLHAAGRRPRAPARCCGRRRCRARWRAAPSWRATTSWPWRGCASPAPPSPTAPPACTGSRSAIADDPGHHAPPRRRRPPASVPTGPIDPGRAGAAVRGRGRARSTSP